MKVLQLKAGTFIRTKSGMLFCVCGRARLRNAWRLALVQDDLMSDNTFAPLFKRHSGVYDEQSIIENFELCQPH